MMRRELIEDFFSREIVFRGVERELNVLSCGEVGKVVSVIGPRRVGKTWYFYSLIGKLSNPMYVNFEDIAFRNIEVEDFFNIIKIFTELKYNPKSILLDEIQVLRGWSVLVRSLHDRGYRVFVTGSSSKLLPMEISTELRGRTMSYILLPFSFREFLKAKGGVVDVHTFEGRGVILRFLKEFLLYGSYPEVVLSLDKDRILREYFNEIFYRDFVERHGIKSIEFGRFLFEFSFQNFSREISLRKIRDYFGKRVSDTTLYDYVDKLQETLNIFFVERFSESIYKRRSWPRKIYVCDTGISRIIRLSEDMGRLMENSVFLELLRKRNYDPLIEIYYWRDVRGEVDFIVKSGLDVRELIQVTYASSRDEIDAGEIKSLVKIGELLNCRNLIIITWDYEDKLKLDNNVINLIPMWKWLIKPLKE